MESGLSVKVVSVFLVLSICFLGYVSMSTFGQPSAVNGKVSIDSRVQFKQNDNVSYYFASDSYVDRLEIASTYFEINSLTMSTSVSTGNAVVTLYDFDPSDNYLKWSADQDVPDARVGFELTGLSANILYDWFIDDRVVAHTLCVSSSPIGYTYSGPWSSHVFVVQKASTGASNDLQASFEYVIDGSLVTFTDKSYGTIDDWGWNFGDGFGSTKQNPAHNYVEGGVYPVSLTIYDPEGQDSKAQVDIKIALGPDNPIERREGGWDIFITPDLTVSVSAVGLLVFGAIMYASAIYLPSIPIITPKGRKILGFIMVIGGLYFFVFIDNSWWSW